MLEGSALRPKMLDEDAVEERLLHTEAALHYAAESPAPSSMPISGLPSREPPVTGADLRNVGVGVGHVRGKNSESAGYQSGSSGKGPGSGGGKLGLSALGVSVGSSDGLLGPYAARMQIANEVMSREPQ
jgi:hypothetical protein